MLGELFEEFEKVLRYRCEARPPAVFILRFMEHISLKTPDVDLLKGLPNGIVSRTFQYTICGLLFNSVISVCIFYSLTD
jgi:hypothetical protein